MDKREKKMRIYSEAFKQKVVKQIENGYLSVSQAKELYDIGGIQTIYRWIRELGKTELISKVVYVKMKDEKSKIKELEKQKRELESALAQAQLKIITLEATITVLSEKDDKKLKKNNDTKS